MKARGPNLLSDQPRSPPALLITELCEPDYAFPSSPRPRNHPPSASLRTLVSIY